MSRAAGVGASTVSLALRNDPRLRPAMREHVQKVAQQIGYFPNATLAYEPGITAKRLAEVLRARGIRDLIVGGMQTDGTLPASHLDFWNSFTSVVIRDAPEEPVVALHLERSISNRPPGDGRAP
ncbi:MAG: helix-turn-helix domain-containing protein [Chthoniobacterales bacterium]